MHVIPVRPRMRLRSLVPDWRAPFASFGLYLAGFLAVVNISIVYLALPDIEQKLGAGLSEQQWIISAYPLMEGSFTLAAGTLGDLFGRKRVLTVSSWLFVLATLACALAPGPEVLIIARGLQGLAGAALLSLPIALLLELLADPAQNEATIKRFTTVAALGAGIAPLIGGVLVQWISWQAVFYFSVALGIVVLFSLPFARDPEQQPGRGLDIPGQILSIAAILAISYALIDGSKNGWGSPLIIGAFVTAAIAFTLFLIVEVRTRVPMIDFRYFRIRAFNLSLLMLGIVNFAWFGMMLIASLFLQDVQGQSEIYAGLYLIPCNAAYFVANMYCNRVQSRFGLSRTVALSFGITMAGMLWFVFLREASPPWEVAAALAIAGLGWGIICTPAAAIGMAAVSEKDEGFASGILAFSRSIFGVFGIAVLGAILDSGMTKRIGVGLKIMRAPKNSSQALIRTIEHGDLFGVSERFTPLVHDSFVRAMHETMLVCLGLTLVFAAGATIALSARRLHLRRSVSSS